nr:uncharacterized protein LOC113403875 [Vanessa tameamea]
MNEQSQNISYPKFTKGEKCIFAHLVLTFSLTLLVTLIYLVHLFLVDHNVHEVFITRKYFADNNDYPELDTVPIGQLFIKVNPIINICNIMLLAPGWSVGPGHCMAMRSDPELSHLLFAWRIKISEILNTTLYADVTIKRSIVHPHFNRDTFANNIGLVQHVTIRGHMKYNVLRGGWALYMPVCAANHSSYPKNNTVMFQFEE